tara:strand:+ start:503 stop:742 length:240 start_codon:yes stop_codon:yes gene_type:complete
MGRAGIVVINSARYICDYEHLSILRIFTIPAINRRRTTASIKKPIHNVKEARLASHIATPSLERQTATLHLWKILARAI